ERERSQVSEEKVGESAGSEEEDGRVPAAAGAHGAKPPAQSGKEKKRAPELYGETVTSPDVGIPSDAVVSLRREHRVERGGASRGRGREAEHADRREDRQGQGGEEEVVQIQIDASGVDTEDVADGRGDEVGEVRVVSEDGEPRGDGRKPVVDGPVARPVLGGI